MTPPMTDCPWNQEDRDNLAAHQRRRGLSVGF